MPTARPIMTASTGVVELTSTTLATTKMPSIPAATPMKAAISGAPAARTEPKVMNRTIAAMTTPMSSTTLSPRLTEAPIEPESWILNCGSAFWAAALASSIWASRRWAAEVVPEVIEPREVSAWIWARACAPSWETVDGLAGVPLAASAAEPKGWETMATPSMADTALTKPSMACRCASISPSLAVNSTCSEVPAACGNRFSRTSKPFIDSALLMVKVEERLAPVRATTPARAAIRTSQAATTRAACSAHQRPTLCSSADTCVLSTGPGAGRRSFRTKLYSIYDRTETSSTG